MRYYPALAVCLVAGSLLLHACHKNDKPYDEDNDPQQPDIQLTAPGSNQVYTSGDTVKIQGTITDNSLHDLMLTITNGSIVLFSKEISVHDLSSYTINEGWKSSVSAVTNAVVKAEVEDHGHHTVNKTVNITINP